MFQFCVIEINFRNKNAKNVFDEFIMCKLIVGQMPMIYSEVLGVNNENFRFF